MNRFPGFDPIVQFKNNWNRHVRSLRIGCFALGIAMVILGILCMAYPIEIFQLLQVVVSIVLMAWGIYQIITYLCTTSYFKEPLVIVMGIMNIMFGWFLLSTPVEITATMIAFMLAIVLMFSGAEKLSFANRMRNFAIPNTAMFRLSGIVTILLSIVFIVMPLSSAIVLNFVVALYLISNGILLLMEAISMKELRL